MKSIKTLIVLAAIVALGSASIAGGGLYSDKLASKSHRYSADDTFASNNFDLFDANNGIVGSFWSDATTGGADLIMSTSENRDLGLILGASDGENYLQFTDKNGTVRIAMGVDSAGRAGFALYDARGRAKFKKVVR